MIFSPFSGIWRHTVLESQIIEILSESREFEVISVGCGRLFPEDCTVRAYFRGSSELTHDNSITNCDKCSYARELFSSNTSAQCTNLQDYVHPGDLKSVQSLLKNINHQDAEKFVFENLQLGKKALYEIILKYKKRTTNLDVKEFEEWKSILTNAALVVAPARRLLEEIKPDVVISCNAQYAIPGTFAEIASEKKIKTYILSGSPSPVESANAIKIWDWQKYKATDPALHEWPGVQALPPLNSKSLARYSRHERYISSGKSPWTYSSAKSKVNPFDFFKIERSKKIVLAVINSEDEIFAARIAELFPPSRTESSVFESQLDWIRFLIDYYSQDQETHLIIRLHPREFPNKRENQLSEQAAIWDSLLSSLPPNIHIDHPRDGYSFYDYLKHINVLTTGWSSTAIEALAYGISVVTYDQNLLGYPADELLTGDSIEQYKINLDCVERTERKFERMEFARQWINFAHFKGAIYLGGGVQDAHLRTSIPALKFFLRGINRILNLLAPKRIKKVDLKLPRFSGDKNKVINLISFQKDNLFQL